MDPSTNYQGMTWTSGTGKTSPSDCQYSCRAGYYKKDRDGLCTLCDKGTYKADQGLGPCTPCPAGSISGDTGATACTPCVAGVSFTSQAGMSMCSMCNRQTANVGYWVTACTVTSDYAAVSCSLCNAGYYLNPTCVAGNMFTSPPSCTACPAGTYQPSGSQANAACQVCSAGTLPAPPTPRRRSLPGSISARRRFFFHVDARSMPTNRYVQHRAGGGCVHELRHPAVE